MPRKGNGQFDCEFDHIVPLAEGGLDTIENLQALVKTCHREKTEREVEQGYFKKSSYASTFNDTAHELLMNGHFNAVQRVEALWAQRGGMATVTHEYDMNALL